MSNYAFIMADHSQLAAIGHWLDRHAGIGEVHRVTLTHRVTLFVLAPDVESSIRDSSFFRGNAVLDEEGAIVFGADGWEALRAKRPAASTVNATGEFVTATWDPSGLVVQGDIFTCVAVLHTRGRGFAAVSDSLLLLSSLRAALGEHVTPDREVLLARSVLNGQGTQQMSHRTFVNGVSFVPAGRHLRIGTRWLQPRLSGAPTGRRVLEASQDDPVTTLRRSASFLTGHIAALASVPDWSLKIMLSGGYDSRVVVAAAHRLGVLDGVRVESVNSLPSHRADHIAARGLATEFGFSLNGPGAPSRELPHDRQMAAMSAWASTLLGTYDRLLPAADVRRLPSSFQLTGIGAEIFKGNWGWKSVGAHLAGLQPMEQDRLEAYKAQLELGVRDQGGKPHWADASELQYIGFRNGLHAAPHVTQHLVGARPVMQLGLAAIGHRRTDGRVGTRKRDRATFWADKRSIVDVLALVSPEMARMPYDVPEKTVTDAEVSGRLTRLGGPLANDEIASVRVFGSPSNMPTGMLQLGASIAREYGFGVPARSEDVLDLAREVVDGADLPDDVKTIYKRVEQRARWSVLTKGLPIHSSGAALPKVLSLALFQR